MSRYEQKLYRNLLRYFEVIVKQTLRQKNTPENQLIKREIVGNRTIN